MIIPEKTENIYPFSRVYKKTMYKHKYSRQFIQNLCKILAFTWPITAWSLNAKQNFKMERPAFSAASAILAEILLIEQIFSERRAKATANSSLFGAQRQKTALTFKSQSRSASQGAHPEFQVTVTNAKNLAETHQGIGISFHQHHQMLSLSPHSRC